MLYITKVLTVRRYLMLVRIHQYEFISKDLLTVDKDPSPSGIKYKFVCAYIFKEGNIYYVCIYIGTMYVLYYYEITTKNSHCSPNV